MENCAMDGNNKIPCFCRECGTKLRANSAFCHNCGTKTVLDSPVVQCHEPVAVIHTPNDIEIIKKRNKRLKLGSVFGVVIILAVVLIVLLLGSNRKEEIYNVCLRTITFSDESTAEYVYSIWKNGESTEQTLVALLNEYGAKQGNQGAGSREYVVRPGEYVKEIDEWCFSSDRKVGDCAIIENVYGYSICYISDINFEPDYYMDEDGVIKPNDK